MDDEDIPECWEELSHEGPDDRGDVQSACQEEQREGWTDADDDEDGYDTQGCDADIDRHSSGRNLLDNHGA
eukprot:10505456-Karenia_brevis.AAC.1